MERCSPCNPCKSRWDHLIMSDRDYGRSRVSNITLYAAYTIYRRFLGKFPRLDTVDRMSWNFAGGEADFARRETRSRSKIACRITANGAYTQLVRAPRSCKYANPAELSKYMFASKAYFPFFIRFRSRFPRLDDVAESQGKNAPDLNNSGGVWMLIT